MEKEEFERYQQKVLKFTLSSIVTNVNGLDMTDEEKENLLNIVFNILLNSLNPDAAIVWNEEILSLTSMVKDKNLSSIMSVIKDDFKKL